jgi:hypothetical protein
MTLYDLINSYLAAPPSVLTGLGSEAVGRIIIDEAIAAACNCIERKFRYLLYTC